MAAPKLIVADTIIATHAVTWWPEPAAGHYQAKIMTTIALMESSGDTYALLMNAPPSQLAGYVDRGLWGINEGAINFLLGRNVDPITFIDAGKNSEYARNIWDWRYARKWLETRSTTKALVYAYEGWTTYRKARTEKSPAYVAAWATRWPRAVAAVNEVTQ